MGRKDMLHLESARFSLVYDVPRSVVKGVNSTHEAAHVVLDRLETIHAEFLVDTGAAEADLGAPTQVMLWGNERDQEKASSKWTLERTSTIAKLMGKAPVLSICFGKGNVRNEADLEHALAHQVAHCGSLWTFTRACGWAARRPAGSTRAMHLVEIRRTGSVEHWCSITDEAEGKLKFNRFEAEVLTRSADGKVTGTGGDVGQGHGCAHAGTADFWLVLRRFPHAHAPGEAWSRGQVPAAGQAGIRRCSVLGVNRSIDDFQRDWAGPGSRRRTRRRSAESR